ncbi:hypothetical protein PNH38_04625 [Anoxybacillus rupiensis]|uniref:Uncharacterized protein n=1 Tax=Anoxybacteroides rupiense TaxID=311460 RepID=A0ABT5W3Q1_9BACL|nr:hypothetical protein [Anoxybacillus rupiensis]
MLHHDRALAVIADSLPAHLRGIVDTTNGIDYKLHWITLLNGK